VLLVKVSHAWRNPISTTPLLPQHNKKTATQYFLDLAIGWLLGGDVEVAHEHDGQLLQVKEVLDLIAKRDEKLELNWLV
jgi:hemin uptake protein HemP